MLEETVAIEPIVAFRWFHVDKCGRLGPIGYGAGSNATYAAGNKYQAVHVDSLLISGFEHKPFASCKCGFYGWKEGFEQLPQTIPSLAPLLFYGGPVLLSGIVVEHEFGYRAMEMTVLPFERVLQYWRYYLQTSVNATPFLMSATYTMQEWRVAISDDPWPKPDGPPKPRYVDFLYTMKEISRERLQP